MSQSPTEGKPAYYFDDAMESLTAYLRDSVTADLFANAACVGLPGDARRWYDVRPMVDADLHDPAVVQMNQRAVAVGLAFLILHLHPELPYLVRVDGPDTLQ